MARGGVTGGSIRVEGLRELINAFYKMDRQLSKEIRQELILIGNLVVDEARDTQMPQQQLAAGQLGQDGVPNTGKLQKSLRAKMQGQSTAVVESRKPRGSKYAYGAIYEFDQGRPFLVPALEAKTDDIMEALGDMVDRLVSANGFGRGGIL